MSEEVGDAPRRNASDFLERHGEEPRAAQPGDRPTDQPGPTRHVPAGSLWEVANVSAYLRIPVSSIYKMTARKAAMRIPHIRISGKLRFRRHDIDQWLSLLTTSNIEALAKVRQKILKATDGNHP